MIPALLAAIGLLKAFAAAYEHSRADSDTVRAVATYQGVAALLAFVVLGVYALRASRAQ